jgi:hypothetical protein
MSNGYDRNALIRLIVYTIIISLAAVALLIFVVLKTPTYQEITGASEDMVQPQIFLMTILTMFVAGVIGGCLYNYRGIIKHTADEDYSNSYNVTYFLRPILGGISGLTVFFILLGGALSLNLGGKADTRGWMTFAGRMPYIAFAILSGYASQEFMQKLKEVSKTLFQVKETTNAKKEKKAEP